MSITDLKVQLLYGSNSPLNENIIHKRLTYYFFAVVILHYSIGYSKSHRDAVDMKGLDKVPVSNSISQGAIHTLIWVNGCYCGDGGSHCVWSLAQHGHILLLRKLWGVIVLVYNANIDGG